MLNRPLPGAPKGLLPGPIPGALPRVLLAASVAVLCTLSTAAVAAPAQAATRSYRLDRATMPDGKRLVVRWNPCQAGITYRINVDALPASMRRTVKAELRRAVRKVSGATGMPFTYLGTTHRVPRSTNLSGQKAEIVIAATTSSGTDYPIGGTTIGYGGHQYRWWGRTTSTGTTYGVAIRRGFVVLDVPGLRRLNAGFGAGPSRGNLMLHELGHVVGLEHVANTHQLMHPMLTGSSPKGFGAGDRAGLARVGRPAGCISVPPGI